MEHDQFSIALPTVSWTSKLKFPVGPGDEAFCEARAERISDWYLSTPLVQSYPSYEYNFTQTGSSRAIAVPNPHSYP
ncbi:unnamed protein product [Zymoseptoria tritici ST99CH_3D7]|uniref:Uncharacterized protein n=1 Tax=Zymoseptoria tritici (strain ST99CH_3D7) TaxID=1276538 RepID=A0A1X7S682_ZYMT9|nr:unnamed protein product [Zymoseptoria tritici ST99CH_3D7]